jgi:hypothetical protein
VIHYYDRDGKELDGVLAWAEKFEEDEYRFLRVEDVEGPDGRPYRVSTIWEGIDKRLFQDQEELLIFQTGAFLLNDAKDSFEGMVGEWMWPTESEALAGHETVVDQIMAGAVGANDIDEGL